jgi:hypothetical protein
MTDDEIWGVWDEVIGVNVGIDPVPFARASLASVPGANIENVAQILACEIECDIFEQHVIPALEVVRKALLAAPTIPVTADDGESMRPVASDERELKFADWWEKHRSDDWGCAVPRATAFNIWCGVLATCNATPIVDAPEVPWWKVMELAAKHGKGWSKYSGWAFLTDDNLHAFAQAIAASAPRETS